MGAAVLTQACSRFHIVPRRVLGGRGYVPPSEKLNIAGIGVGGQGGGDIDGVSSQSIVALCDVDERRAADTFKRFPEARQYRDFRVMLDREKGIDAVTVSTPDHVHAAAASAAIARGKHVFVQKPLTHSIYEARRLTEMAREQKVATHMGIQGHAGDGMRRLAEWIGAGVVGPVREVHIWTNRPIWPQGIDRPKESPEVPPELDWDLWLGPAPARPYHPCYLPFNWRGWWDFGTGALGDIGCHAMDASFWILDLGAADTVEVEAETAPVNDETAPEWSQITFHFPARGEKPPLRLFWYDGGKTPPVPDELKEEGRGLPGDNGVLFVGDKGKIISPELYGGGPRLIPEARMKEFDRPPETLASSIGHYLEWIQACKGGAPAGANFDYAGPLTETALLGNLAVRAGEKIRWSAKKMEVTNCPKANRYVRDAYRRGWRL